MSLRLRLINAFLRAFEKPHLARARSHLDLRRSFEIKSRLFLHGPRGSRYEACDLGGVRGLRVTAPGAQGDRAILHFHGGGYIFGSPNTHQAMLARLSGLTGRVAFLPDYRKAPEHPFPAAVEDAVAAFTALCASVDPGRIVLGGDSAGGGLALALLGEICARDLPEPGGTYVFSPLTDMTFSGASVRENEGTEAILPAGRIREMEAAYLQGADPRDPRASPLFAQFAGASPVWLAASDSELLRDDTIRMAAHLRAQGVVATEVIGHDLPHVWPMFPRILPQAAATLAQVADWIRSL